MAESEEELKSLLMKVKEESEKAGLKVNIPKTKIKESNPIISWQIDGETMETVTDIIFLGSKITTGADCSHEIKRYFLLGRKPMTNLESESEVAQSCPTLCDLRTAAHQAPPPMAFSRQEYWSGLPFPSPGDLPDPGIEPRSPTLQPDTLTSVPPGKPLNTRIQVLTSKISREERKPG